jgi:hypothetical protein
MKGLAVCLRVIAAAWPDRQIVQASLAQLTWYHHIALLEKLDSPAPRLWYAARALERGWFRSILAFRIDAQVHRRRGKAQTNCAKRSKILSTPRTDGYLTRLR